MAKAKQSKFTVTVRIVIIQDTEVSANTFEEAVEKSKQIRAEDVISWHGCANDCSIHVVGINVPNAWSVD